MKGVVKPSCALCLALAFAWYLNGAAGLLYLQDSQNGTIQIFSDQPAEFSPPVNDVVYGMLVITQPIDACTPIAQPNYTNGSPWVALISRSDPNNTCHFAVKVCAFTQELEPFSRRINKILAYFHTDSKIN